VFNCVNKDFDAPASLLNTPDMLTQYIQLQHTTREARKISQAASGALGRVRWPQTAST